MEYLKYILEGMRQVLVLDTSAHYIRPSRHDFSQDTLALGNDAKQIATDLKKVTYRHVKQIDTSKT